MSTSPVTMMVARRVADGRYQDLLAWLHEGLGSGVLAPPPGDNEFQMIFRFSDATTLGAWEHSASRKAWLARGSDLFAGPQERRVSGIDGWFGAAGQRPPRWKQAVAIWLAFFPVSLLFNFGLGPLLAELVPRVMVSTLVLTPLMVYFFIPLSTHLLAGWLHSTQAKALPGDTATARH
jgi:antibiotic biosynthesis monooxygenase (ABM) superfamily enzyme